MVLLLVLLLLLPVPGRGCLMSTETENEGDADVVVASGDKAFIGPMCVCWMTTQSMNPKHAKTPNTPKSLGLELCQPPRSSMGRRKATVALTPQRDEPEKVALYLRSGRMLVPQRFCRFFFATTVRRQVAWNTSSDKTLTGPLCACWC